LEVVGDCDESDFGGYFFKASEHEPFEPFVVFYIAEYRFYLPSLSSFLYSQVAFKQLFYFFPVTDEVGVSLDDAVARGFVAGTVHWASLAVFGLIEPQILNMAIGRFSLPVADILHLLADRAVIGVTLLVIIKIVRLKGFSLCFLSVCSLSK